MPLKWFVCNNILKVYQAIYCHQEKKKHWVESLRTAQLWNILFCILKREEGSLGQVWEIFLKYFRWKPISPKFLIKVEFQMKDILFLF